MDGHGGKRRRMPQDFEWPKARMFTLDLFNAYLGFVWGICVLVSNIFYFHPENWGRFPIWLIYFRWVETTKMFLNGLYLSKLPSNSIWEDVVTFLPSILQNKSNLLGFKLLGITYLARKTYFLSSSEMAKIKFLHDGFLFYVFFKMIKGKIFKDQNPILKIAMSFWGLHFPNSSGKGKGTSKSKKI